MDARRIFARLRIDMARRFLPRSALFQLVAMLFLWMAFCSAARGGEATKAQFLKEYGESDKQLATAYQNAVISATVTERHAQKKPADVAVIELRTSGRLVRMDINATGIDERGPFTRQYSVVCNPAKGSFIVDRYQDLDRFGLRRKDDDHQGIAAIIYLRCQFARAPFGFYDATVREVLDIEGVVVERFERCNVEGQERAKLTLTRKGEGDKVFPYATMTFDPARHWALTEHTHGSAITCQIEYAPSDKGVPLVKSIHRWHRAIDGSRDQEMIAEVHSFVLKPSPDSDFTIASFGFEDK